MYFLGGSLKRSEIFFRLMKVLFLVWEAWYLKKFLFRCSFLSGYCGGEVRGAVFFGRIVDFGFLDIVWGLVIEF